jgi:endonuclease/exonuclease/phosphatase family metal-dependent hydrolase
MTFNVRQPDQDDGLNGWEYRRDLLVNTILEKDPDVIGTQELFLLQAEYIQQRAPQYEWFGRGRFGNHDDKHVGIFYRKDRLTLTSQGDLWLSETPHVPGSSSWDIIRPRQLTWGTFEASDVGRFHLFNTHFPYRAVEHEARLNTARLITDQLGILSPAAPIVLTADFNSPADGDVYRRLGACFRDAWRDAALRHGPDGTLNGFGRHMSDRRIDWILYRGPWRVIDAETVTSSRDGRYPSDHFPVIATFDTTAPIA